MKFTSIKINQDDHYKLKMYAVKHRISLLDLMHKMIADMEYFTELKRLQTVSKQNSNDRKRISDKVTS